MQKTNRTFTIIGGNTMTAGGSLNLAPGTLGLFDVSKETSSGLTAVSTLAGEPKNKEFQIKVGSSQSDVTRSQSNKPDATVPFKLSEVLDVRVSAPKTASQIVDEVVVGYNGIDASTSISFAKGDRKTIFIRLSGENIGMLGFPNNYVDIEYTMEEEACNPKISDCTECDDCTAISCAPIILRAIEFIKSYELRGGVTVADMVDITPVRSCGTSPSYSETDYSFFRLTVTDLGDAEALALVQAQYPTQKISRIARTGTQSTYEFLALGSYSPSAYSASLASLLKGCEACPSGYTASTGGFLYAVTIDDAGADLSTTVDDLSNFVSGTCVKQGQDGNIGLYTLILSAELSDANKATFLAASTAKATATITKVGEVDSICANATTSTTAWTEEVGCKASTETYTIVLPDDECGTSRLTELAAAYPDLSISVATTTAVNDYEIVTFATGSAGGTATITIGGVGYTATFDTSLALTAQNFVATHKAAVEAATGGTLEYIGNSNTIKFTDLAADLDNSTITITNNVSGTLTATEGTVTADTEVRGGCLTKYTTTVITNIVCPECDDIYLDSFKTSAPLPFDGVKWELTAPSPAYSTDCLCGMKLKGKVLEVQSNEYLRDTLGFIDGSVKIEVSGGYITEVMEGLGVQEDEVFAITYLNRWQPRTHLGGNLQQFEDEGMYYFTGESRHDDVVARMLKGQESRLKQGSQYVDYALDISRNQVNNHSQGSYGSIITYHFLVELGRHTNVEAIMNLIAAKAGLPGVKAYA